MAICQYAHAVYMRSESRGLAGGELYEVKWTTDFRRECIYTEVADQKVIGRIRDAAICGLIFDVCREKAAIFSG